MECLQSQNNSNKDILEVKRLLNEGMIERGAKQISKDDSSARIQQYLDFILSEAAGINHSWSRPSIIIDTYKKKKAHFDISITEEYIREEHKVPLGTVTMRAIDREKHRRLKLEGMGTAAKCRLPPTLFIHMSI